MSIVDASVAIGAATGALWRRSFAGALAGAVAGAMVGVVLQELARPLDSDDEDDLHPLERVRQQLTPGERARA